MRPFIFSAIVLLTLGFLTGCGGNDASAKEAEGISGTVKLAFILPGGQDKIRCRINVGSDKVSVNVKGKSGGDKYRLNGSIQVTDRDAKSVTLAVKMMLYKNERPDGSFNFPVKVTKGITKQMNLSLGMMLSARF